MRFARQLAWAVVLLGAPSSIAFADVPPPPVMTSHESQRELMTWTPSQVRCAGDMTVDSKGMVAPHSTLSWPGDVKSSASVTLTFDIDVTGRAVSIKDARYPNDDLGPALAASHFPAKARQACTVTYTVVSRSLAEAAPIDLIAYAVSPITGNLPPQSWARIRGEGDCMERPTPQPLMRALPDFQKIAATPGVKNWVMLGYDTDKSGRPVKIRTIAESGNAALVSASTKAMHESRYTGGARTGCTYRYWRDPAAVPAPPIPPLASYRADGACSGSGNWETLPNLRFPPAYARREIEGWAILGYDTAPWGGVGNIKVLDVQPSDEFGRMAMHILQNAKVKASAHGTTGCVDVIKFVTHPQGAASEEADENEKPIRLR